MKLDRNIDPHGRGKYALVKMRKLNPILNSTILDERSLRIAEAFALLSKEGMIHFGDESPSDQFFVMKYKDKFTHHALSAYAAACELESLSPHPTDLKIKNPDLKEFADEIFKEAKIARSLGKNLPD